MLPQLHKRLGLVLLLQLIKQPGGLPHCSGKVDRIADANAATTFCLN